MQVLEISNINKRYGPIHALKDLSLEINKGNVFGILGPNGSGKTTSLGIILGIIKADSGSYTWFGGQDEVQARKRIGAILETPNFYPYLDALENLKIIRRIKKCPDPDYIELLEMVGLAQRKHSNFNTFSLGMKQRLAIASTMIGDPDLLIFDEPTNGLDPKGIAEVRHTLLEIAQSGKSVIMASHILTEVEKICSHVAILQRGKLLATGPVGSIINKDRILEIGGEDLDKIQQALVTYPGINNTRILKEILELSVSEDFEPSELNRFLLNKGLVLSRLYLRPRRLEQEFLQLTNKTKKYVEPGNLGVGQV